jgi:hypothetical protein
VCLAEPGSVSLLQHVLDCSGRDEGLPQETEELVQDHVCLPPSLTQLTLLLRTVCCSLQHALERYGRDKGLPQEMKELIEGHLRLNFTTNQEADEQMLLTLPTTLRR